MASAAILVGGAARRFDGRDKSALVIGGRTILARQMATLRPLTDDLLMVGCVPALPPPGVRAVADRTPGRGPLGGLDAAFGAAASAPLILLACDMPYVSTDLLAHLLSLAPEADVVVPITGRGYHPLCAVYGAACHEPVARRLARGQLALKALFDEVRVRAVGEEELARFGAPERLLANVNTPEDFDRIEALSGHTR